jgi:predicted amino acid-binding ACT domain protein
MSVLVADRVGILRDITSAVTGLGANIDGISQTVVEGYFTVILAATFQEPRTVEDIREAILANFSADEASVVVRPFDATADRGPTVDGEHYVVTLAGKDGPGILMTVTTCLAEKGINVEDWYVHFEGPNVTHVGEVTVPHLLDVTQVQSELQERVRQFGLTVSVQHENIFRVTNEVGAVRPLITGKSNG